MTKEEERRHADMVHEASLPVSEQEYFPLKQEDELDPAAARWWGSTADDRDYTYSGELLHALLRIIIHVGGAQVAWRIYRCFQAYCAGFRGCRYLWAPGTAEAFWFEEGRANAEKIRHT